MSIDARISDDIQSVIDWEIANGNSVAGVHHPFGAPVVAMTRPIRQWLDGERRAVPPTLTWWQFRDPHYPEEEWCAGFESSESGHKIAGPLR